MVKVRVNWGPLEEGRSVKLFVVYNTAHNRLYVLAQNEKEAMNIAYTANHVYFPQQKYAETYSRAAYEVLDPPCELSNHWNAIQHAMDKRVQGTIHLEGDHIAVGYEAFAG